MIYNVGDETDQFWGGLWDKGAEFGHTPNQELEAAREHLRPWYEAFPEMKLCTSNHGERWKRKASHAQIPSQLLREYKEVIGAPQGWQWKKHWIVPTKHPVLVEHGDDWGGQHPHIDAALYNGMSTAMGHHHSLAEITHLQTARQRLWGAVCGSLIDFEAYAFEYARRFKKKPVIGTLVGLNHGKMPLFVPIE